MLKTLFNIRMTDIAHCSVLQILLPLLLSHTSSTAPLTTLFLTPIFIPLPHYPTRSIRAADGSTEHSDYVDSFLDADHVTEVQSMLH